MITYAKLDDDTWGIRIDPPGVNKSGDRVEVRKRDGSCRVELLGERFAHNDRSDFFRIERQAPAPRELTKLEGDMGRILKLFDSAKKHLKFPAIVLAWKSADNRLHLVKINVAGEKANKPGTLNVLSYGRNDDGERDWFGRILLDGNFEASPRASLNALENIKPALKAFAADPAGEAKRSARLTGRCCFCNRDLVDERSTAVGYGSTCASHYDLPWGAEKTNLAELVS